MSSDPGPDGAAPIVPVLLCGGSGTRLWPLSRQSHPKQFAKLLLGRSLFQATACRFATPRHAPPLVVTSRDFRYLAEEQLNTAGVAPGAIITEPAERNTAASALVAALALGPAVADTLLLIQPCDHLLAEESDFRSAVAAALPTARDGRIVTFGITPRRAETGFGYLETTGIFGGARSSPQPVLRFTEKPETATAEVMFASGRHFWNAGIFLLSARTLIAAFEAHAPHILSAAAAALNEARRDGHAIHLDAGHWERLPDISLDCAIMEKAGNLSVMPYDGSWSDVGSWDAVWQEGEADSDGNVLSAHALGIGCRKTLLRSEASGLEIVGIGLEDILAVAMPDAVLVARKGDGQRVREAVEALRSRAARQASSFSRDERPWGWFEILARGPRFQVKRLMVRRGAALSLQSHRHRDERWVVVEGTARVTLEGAVQQLSESQSVYVPRNAVHRLENPGDGELVLIEVQTGDYLGEDDITRYEDAYARS